MHPPRANAPDVISIADAAKPRGMARAILAGSLRALGQRFGTRNRPIAPVESGPCCQDSPMLSRMGLMIEPARHPPTSRT